MNLRLNDKAMEAVIKEQFGHLSLEEQGRERYRLHNLMRAAQPGNVPWHILESEYGFDGDYQDSDAGEPPQGAKW